MRLLTCHMGGKIILFSKYNALVSFSPRIPGITHVIVPQVIQHSCYATTTSRTHYYDVLGIPSNATQGQIKSAYYVRSKLYHPDVNKDADAHRLFSSVAEAYEVLGNVRKRRLYDQGLGQRYNFQESNYQNKEGFTPPKRYHPTGRTSTYNFDEFYRMHYGDILKKKKDAKDYEEKLEADLKEVQQNKITSYIITTVFMGFVVGLINQLMKQQR